MNKILTAATLLCLIEMSAMADNTARFETDPIGASPKGWTATKTGKGAPKWTVEQDRTAHASEDGDPHAVVRRV